MLVKSRIVKLAGRKFSEELFLSQTRKCTFVCTFPKEFPVRDSFKIRRDRRGRILICFP